MSDDLMRLRADGMKWQPIETAPMDVDVLVWMDFQRKDDGSTITMAQCIKETFDDEECWCWYAPAPDVKDGMQVMLRYEPTHWMPLPEPPQEKADE